VSLLRRTLGCLLLSSALSCSAASPAAASHPPVPGPMPAGEQWRGLYQGPYHIILNVWTKGALAKGNWRAVGDREGELSGTVRGNLLTFEWSEQARDRETWSGTGYFVHSAGKAGEPAQIFGEWGMGKSAKTATWWAKKRANEPLGDETGQIDRDADQQYQDDAPGCEMAGCDSSDQDFQ
jgi:hypothetical protein